MNKYFGAALVLVGILLAAAASASGEADGNSVLSHATAHDRLMSIAFTGDHGIAVGEAGVVMISDDGGTSWKSEQAPTELELTAVAINPKRAIAVGQMGLILVKNTGGKWQQVDSGTSERLLQVDINKNGLAFAVGAFGTLLKSSDGGNTWTSVAPNWSGLYNKADAGPRSAGSMSVPVDEPTNYVVKVLDDGSVIIGGEFGALLRSADAGKTWNIVYRYPPVEEKIAPSIFGMRIRADGGGYAVGQSGLVLQTSDAGRSWIQRPTPVDASLFGVESSADGQVAVVGMRIGLRSSDGGNTWVPINALDLRLNWYSDVARSASRPAGEFTAVGHSGRIVRLAP